MLLCKMGLYVILQVSYARGIKVLMMQNDEVWNDAVKVTC